MWDMSAKNKLCRFFFTGRKPHSVGLTAYKDGWGRNWRGLWIWWRPLYVPRCKRREWRLAGQWQHRRVGVLSNDCKRGGVPFPINFVVGREMLATTAAVHYITLACLRDIGSAIDRCISVAASHIPQRKIVWSFEGQQHDYNRSTCEKGSVFSFVLCTTPPNISLFVVLSRVIYRSWDMCSVYTRLYFPLSFPFSLFHGPGDNFTKDRWYPLVMHYRRICKVVHRPRDYGNTIVTRPMPRDYGVAIVTRPTCRTPESINNIRAQYDWMSIVILYYIVLFRSYYRIVISSERVYSR